jgi:hypothetical protein
MDRWQWLKEISNSLTLRRSWDSLFPNTLGPKVIWSFLTVFALLMTLGSGILLASNAGRGTGGGGGAGAGGGGGGLRPQLSGFFNGGTGGGGNFPEPPPLRPYFGEPGPVGSGGVSLPSGGSVTQNTILIQEDGGGTPNVVPEPLSASLFLLGASALWGRSRRGRS